MEYQEKTVQRIFSIRFSGGERIIESLERLIQEKNIRAGAILFAGTFSNGNLVSGFRKHSKVPMDFNPMSFSQSQEVLGMGSISWVNDRPKVRLQAGIGKEREVFIGRIEEAGVAGVEAFVLEFSGNSSPNSVLV